ncbi:MAG: prepilin-type N-terminal cleavage/methylation domain-containing protein [Acidimicrobiia bacterium]
MRRSEDGFTLIEIMVVVLILAVLIGIAIPTYIGFRGRTQDTETKSEVANGAKILGAFAATVGSGYTDDPATLKPFEPSIDFSGVASNSLHLVVADAVASGDNGQVLVYSRSNSGTWFGLRLVNAGLTAGQYTCLGGSEADIDDMTDCASSEW